MVTIEDALELNLPHENNVAPIAERAKGSERRPAQLLVLALWMRPDRLILGGEALAFLEAINTGHLGSISTTHANSPALVLDRLALMVMRTGTRLTGRTCSNTPRVKSILSSRSGVTKDDAASRKC